MEQWFQSAVLCFCVLPFGLATACYLFTKLMCPLVKHWRGQGLRAILYLDDDIIAVAGKEAACAASEKVQASSLMWPSVDGSQTKNVFG